jgi:PAS domain S-box-containing protein
MKDINYLKKELYELVKTDESIFDFIQESSLDGLWYWDLEHPEEEWMNPKFWTVLGYNPDEMPHKAAAWRDIIHPDDLKLAYERVTKHLANPEYPYDQTIRYTHKNGSTVWIRCRGLAIRDKDGKPVRMLGAHHDITELRNSTLLLQKNTSLLRNAQIVAKIGSWELDLKTNEVVWTEALYNMYGFDPALPPPPYTEHKKLFTPESWEQLSAALDLARVQGIPYELELQTLRKDGEHGWMWVRGEAIYDENENIVGLRGAARDITDEKRVALEKEALTKRLNYALDASGDGIWDWTPADGKTVYSKAWLEMLGFKVGELAAVASEWAVRLHPDDAEWVFTEINQITQTPDNGDTFSHEYRFRNKAGEYLWILNKAKVVERNEKGEASRVVGTHTNITERKKKEAEIAAISQEIRDITNAVNEGSALSITNAQDIIVKVNKQFCELSGYTEEELIGHNHDILNADYHDEEFWRNQKATIMAGKTWKGEIKKRKKDGGDYWVSCVIQPVLNDSGKVVQYISIRQDITERKKAEEEIKRTTLLLEAAQHLAKMGAWELDLATGKTFWTEEVYHIHEVEKDFDHNEANGIAFYHPDYRPIISTAIADSIEKQIPFNVKCKFITAKNNLRWVRASGYPIIKDGQVTHIVGMFKDITQEEADKEAIFQEQLFSKQLLENMADGFSVIDTEGRQITVNKAFCEMTGFSEEELIGQTAPYPYRPAEELGNFNKAFQKTLEGGLNSFELIFQKKNGERFPVLLSTSVLKDEGGNTINYFSNIKDITERKKAELELTKTKDFLLQTGRVAKVGGWDFNNLTGEISWSDVICDIHEVPHGFVPTYEQMANFYTPESWIQLEQAIQKALAEGIPYDLEVQITTAKSKVCWVRAIGNSEFKDGKCLRLFGVLQDINDRKIIQLEKEESELRFTVAIDGTEAGIWDWDMINSKVVFSKQWKAMLGYEEAEIENSFEGWQNLWHPDDADAIRKSINDHLNGITQKYEVIHRCLHKNGEWRWIMTRGKILRNPEGKPYRWVGTNVDITEQKKSEQALKDSELRLSLAIQAGGVGVWDWNIVENILTWDEQMFTLYGVKRGKFSNAYEAWVKGVYEADRDRAMVELELAMKGEKEFDTEFRVQTPDGHIRNIRALATIVRDKEGNAIRMIGTNWDITDEKEALKQIEEANQKLKSVFDGMQDVIFAVEAETFKTIFVTPSAEDFYGYTIDEWYTNAQLWSEVIIDEHKSIIPQMFKNLEEEGFSQSEYKIKTKSGTLKWVKNRVKVVKENGVVARFEGVVIDITKEKEVLKQIKEAKEQAEESEHRLIIAQGVTKVGSWETDLQTLEVVWSEETYKIFGTDHLSFQASHPAFLEFVHPDDKEKVDNAFLESFTKTGINTVEHRIITVDNIVKHVEERWQIHSDPNGKPTRAVGTCQDITERKLAENELRLAKEQAEAASKAKSEFLANMSHEIRTPLNGVIGFTDLLTKTPLSPVQQQYADSASVSGHTLMGIINDILDFSKIEAGMLELEAVKTDMLGLLENSIDIVKFSAADKAIELLLDIDPTMPRFAYIDAIRTKQILANLLGNAVKFTQKGEVALKVVYHALEGNQGKLSISVRDTGIGITEEQRTKLFKSFSQADSSTTRKFGGTGLGLVISQMIAEKMGSKINIDSVPDVGSTFFFDLITHFEEGEKPDSTQIIGIKRALIIDDNQNNRLILEQMLKHWQIATDSCSNGLEALHRLEITQSYDVIICDYDMPYLNGIDTIRLMKDKLKLNTEKKAVILLYSSLDNTELNQKCKELGICSNLSKPVKSHDLFTYLSHLNQKVATLPQQETGPTAEKIDKTSEKIKILIVEDNPLNMVLSKTILSQMMPNSEVYEARNGFEAIEQYKSINLDLIFMDVHMPELDGIETTKQIRSLETNTGNHLPIIALTAGALKEEKERCLAAGMDDFLTKPLETQKIQAVSNKFFQQGKKFDTSLQKASLTDEVHFGFKELLNNLGGHNKVVKQVISATLDEIPISIRMIEEARSKVSMSSIEAIAHSIRGTSLSMFCNVLSDIAGKIEDKAKENNFQPIDILLLELKGEWERVRNLLLQKINQL